MSDELDNLTHSRARKKLGGPLTPEQRQQKQEKFLKVFSETANVKHSCKVASVSRQTFYDWRESDEVFKARLPDTTEDANDTLEYAAHDRAVNGVDSYVVSQGKMVCGSDGKPLIERKYSDTLLITLLKARMPEKYKDKQSIEHSGPNGAPIQQQTFVIDPRSLSPEQLVTLKTLALEMKQSEGA